MPSVFAQPSPGQYDDLSVQDLLNITTGLACWFYNIALFGVIIFAVIAGIRFFLAGGDSAKAGEGRRNLLYIFIAAMVIFGVGVIIITIANAVGADISLVPFSC